MRVCCNAISILTAALLVGLFLGCGASEKSPEGAKTGHHDHDHGPLGPNGGHMVHLHPHDYEAEWLHDDSGKITVIFHAREGKDLKETAVAAADVKINVTIEDNTTTYELRADDPQDGKASKYSKTDNKLLQHLNLVGGSFEAEVDGKTFKGKIEKHEPHDH